MVESLRRPDRADAVRLGIAFVALFVFDAFGLDLPISRLFGSPTGFAWRDHWLVGGVLHADARWLAWALAIALLVNVWRPAPFARGLSRAARAWWIAATLACVVLIPLLKQVSLTSCPWSLAEFGGSAGHVSHWAWGVADGGEGRCFPAGHATAAFCFLPGYFALRASAPRAARAWLLCVLGAGALLGGVQVLRGAHFVSHSLWTGWFCWALTLVSLQALTAFSRRSRPLPAARPATVDASHEAAPSPASLRRACPFAGVPLMDA
jgi:membrane-associated PAP2 superfamily phosphatase